MTTPATAVQCEDCHRPLKDPDSVARGRGPICQAAFDGDTHISPQPRRPSRRRNPDQILLPLEAPVETFDDRGAREHAESVARGEHDDRCEYLAVPGFWLCHCSKRRREAAGHTEPPGELIFQQPICPRCDEEVYHGGDVWTCEPCCVTWQTNGTDATFYDDYGDLDADLAKWRERATGQASTVQEGQS